MNTEIQVSLLRGRQILDHRALQSGGALRVPKRFATRFDLMADEGETLDHDDVVVDFRAGEPLMLLPEGVTGELSGAGGRAPLAARRVEVPPGARGWITLGDTTLLVQSGPPRVASPRPRLPPEARAWVNRAERPLLVVLLLVLGVELLFLNAVRHRRDIPVDAEPEFEAPTHVLRIAPPVVTPPPPKPVQTAAVKNHKPSSASPTTAKPAAPAAKEGASVDAVRAGLVLAFSQVIKEQHLDNGLSPDLKNAFDGVGKRPLAAVDGTSDWHHSGDAMADPSPMRPGLPTMADPLGRVDLKEHPIAYTPFVKLPPPPEPLPDQDPDDVRAVAQQIRLKKFEIQSCYESSLKRNPSLAGKMVIQFEVGQNGAIDDTSFPAEKLSDEAVQDCIAERARGWKLRPLHQHDSLSVAFPFVFAAH
jgi:hypothetical protein